jgi:hypothetical protein
MSAKCLAWFMAVIFVIGSLSLSGAPAYAAEGDSETLAGWSFVQGSSATSSPVPVAGTSGVYGAGSQFTIWDPAKIGTELGYTASSKDRKSVV